MVALLFVEALFGTSRCVLNFPSFCEVKIGFLHCVAFRVDFRARRWLKRANMVGCDVYFRGAGRGQFAVLPAIACNRFKGFPARMAWAFPVISCALCIDHASVPRRRNLWQARSIYIQDIPWGSKFCFVALVIEIKYDIRTASGETMYFSLFTSFMWFVLAKSITRPWVTSNFTAFPVEHADIEATSMRRAVVL